MFLFTFCVLLIAAWLNLASLWIVESSYEGHCYSSFYHIVTVFFILLLFKVYVGCIIIIIIIA